MSASHHIEYTKTLRRSFILSYSVKLLFDVAMLIKPNERKNSL